MSLTSAELRRKRRLERVQVAGETLDETRARMVKAGLDHAQEQRKLERDRKNLAADVLLITAGETEHRALREEATSAGLCFERRSGRYGLYYALGEIGAERVASIQVRMGPFGERGSARRCFESRAETGATLLILVGTAFGISAAQQDAADVIIAEQVALYDDRRVIDRPFLDQGYEVELGPQAIADADPS